MHFPSICSAQTERKAQAHHRSVKTEQTSYTSVIQTSIYKTRKNLASTKVVAGENRSQGCLPSCSGSSSLPALSCLSLGNTGVLVQGNAVWSRGGSSNIHRTYGVPTKATSILGDTLFCLPGRLANSGALGRRMQVVSQNRITDSSRTGLYSEPSKVCSHSQSSGDMAGGRMARYPQRNEATLEQVFKTSCQCSKVADKISCISPGIGITVGGDGIPCSVPPRGTTPEASDEPGPSTVATRSWAGRRSFDTTLPFQVPTVVDLPKSPPRLATNKQPSHTLLAMDRRIPFRLGSSHRRRFLASWRLATRFGDLEYRGTRIVNGGKGNSIYPYPSGSTCESSHRQRSHILGGFQARLQNLSTPDYHSHSAQGNLCTENCESGNSANSKCHKCSCRWPVQEQGPARRMGNTSPRLGEPLSQVGPLRSGPHGNSFQQQVPSVCLPISSSKSSGSQCLPGQLEPMAHYLSLSTTRVGGQSSSGASPLQWEGSSHHSTLSSSSPTSTDSDQSLNDLDPSSPSQAAGSGTMDRELRTTILSMDRVTFLESEYARKWGSDTAKRLVKAFRQSSLCQLEVAWKAFQGWLHGNAVDINTSSLLKFLIYLREVKGLATNTITHYRNALSLPLRMSAELELNKFPFTDLTKGFFLEKPPIPRHIPKWDLDKVLKLILSPKFSRRPVDNFCLLKKTVFLIALASGNRVSELAALERAGIRFARDDSEVLLVVRPGFLYKNQRLGRAPPNIVIKALGTSQKLCPVKSLKYYLEKQPGEEGPLFRNSRTGSALHPRSISRLLCEVIKEADPSSIPQGHDLRRQAVSLAWTRGLEPEEITSRVFWRSSSVFVKRYLSAPGSTLPCVALNTVNS